MNIDLRLIVMIIVVLGIYVTVMGLLVARFLRPGARDLWIVLTAIEIGLAFIFSYTHSDTTSTFWEWYFHPSSELAAGSTFSSGQHLAVALVALVIGWRGDWAKFWQRLYWFVLAAVFVYVGLDEYFALHETVMLWRYTYPLAGAATCVLTVVAFLIGFRKDAYVLLFILLGLGLMGFGGVGLDAFSNQATLDLHIVRLDWFYCHNEFLGIPCWRYGLFEEVFEMAGSSLVLATLVSYVQIKTGGRGWQFTRRALAVWAVLWGIWSVSNLWLISTLRGLVLPHPLQVTYEDAGLRIIGYSTSREVAAPGDGLDLDIYFQNDHPVASTYYLSVHVLTHPEVESMAQSDVQLGNWQYPTTAWVPGFTVRNGVHLDLPNDLPTPASYWIMARVWQPGEGDSPTHPVLDGVPITAADRPLITPDTLVLFSLPVLSDAPVAAPPTPVEYTFAGGLTLSGLSLPETAALGEAIPLAFWWQTAADPAVDVDLTEFLHFFHSNGEDYWVYDRQPFDGRFPTSDWPGDITVMDGFSVTLPEDLPPGEYRVQTGLYEPANRDRIPVTDANGQPVVDYSIVLGTITVTR